VQNHVPALIVSLLASIACSSSSGTDPNTKLELTSHFFKGNYELSGTATFDAPIPKGTSVQLVLTEASASPLGWLDTGNEIRNGVMATDATEIGWAVHQIAPGGYWVSVAADLNRSLWIDEGDSGGYYAGTVENPAQMAAAATTITISSASLTDLDFGASKLRCLAKWGEACSVDSDCRGGACVYANSLRVPAVAGSCVQGTCATPATSCVDGSGQSGTLEVTDCFGDP
jgi:hypothetical protein